MKLPLIAHSAHLSKWGRRVVLGIGLLAMMLAIGVSSLAPVAHAEPNSHQLAVSTYGNLVSLSSNVAAKSKLSVHAKGPMRNTGKLNKNIEKAAQALIAQLSSSQIAGPIGTIIRNKEVRIDRQNPTPSGEINLQVQINGIKGNSTIATALVANRYLHGSKPGNAAELQRVVRNALNSSLNSLRHGKPTIYEIVGNFSN